MNNQQRGKFITFEGCDGCGKSTQLRLLSEYLAKHEVPHVFTREPGGGKISEAIRAILLDGKNAEMTDECEALLYAAARVQHLHDRVEPALCEGKLVIATATSIRLSPIRRARAGWTKRLCGASTPMR